MTRFSGWVALLLVSSCCRSVDVAPLNAALDAAVRKNRGFGGGIVRIQSRPRGVLWEGASGGRGDGRPITADDTFEIASVTKTFTAVCVMLLVEDGRVRLDAPIGELLPESVTRGLLVVNGHDYGPEITVRELLGHTSGLPDYWSDPPAIDGDNAFVRAFLKDPNRMWRPAELLTYARRLKAFAAPGARYHYSDTGYVVLGLILERLTGKTLPAVYRERILTPLAMHDTYFSYRETPPPNRHEAHRYEETLDLHGQRRQSAEWAGGGLVSSARDLGRFVLALAEGGLLRSASTLAQMQSWTRTDEPDVDYGLGLFHLTLDDHRGQLWGHDGHGNAFMYYWPEQHLAFVGTLNQTENDWWNVIDAAIRALCRRPVRCAPARPHGDR